jgi:hypothetical protein
LGAPSLLPYEPEISEIDKISGQIGKNKNGVHPMDGIGEKHQASPEAEIPERNGDDALFPFLRSDPLEKKTHGEHRLSDETKNDPVIEFERRVLADEI